MLYHLSYASNSGTCAPYTHKYTLDPFQMSGTIS
jgi:hypothetical protein